MYVCTAMRKWLVEVEYGIRPFVFMYVYMVSRCDYGLEWKCWANDQPLEWLNMIICIDSSLSLVSIETNDISIYALCREISNS